MRERGSIDTMKLAVAAGITAAFLVAVGYLHLKVERVSSDMAELRESVVAEIAKVRGEAPKAGLRDRKVIQSEIARLETLKGQLEEELKTTRTQVQHAADRAKTEAVRQAKALIHQFGDEQQNQRKEVVGELGQVKQTAATASSKIEDVSADVQQIKTQVATTRFELEKTVSDLKRVNGDLGIQSGLIATNAQELEALRVLGERNYFDFHLERSKQPQRIGDISVILKKTDASNNRFTVEIITGEKRTEKKDRGINEPVQFYGSKSQHMPYELVVNEIQKDFVTGYLSTPKKLVSAGL